MESKIKVWQIKSTIGQAPRNIKVVRALGLRGFGQTRVHKDNNCIRGMINAVPHLVGYELIASDKKASK